MKRALLVFAACIALATSAFAGSWIHVEVIEKNGAEVRVNLPMSAVEVALEVAEGEAFHEGHIQLDECDITVEEMRAIWKELDASGDGEYVTVREDDEEVSVRREGNYIFVDVKDGSDEDGEQVHIEVPVSVIDALFSGSGDQLNIKAAIAELQKVTKGEVIRVQDGDDQVRIWID